MFVGRRILEYSLGPPKTWALGKSACARWASRGADGDGVNKERESVSAPTQKWKHKQKPAPLIQWGCSLQLTAD